MNKNKQNPKGTSLYKGVINFILAYIGVYERWVLEERKCHFRYHMILKTKPEQHE